jgi:hypothetical protein
MDKTKPHDPFLKDGAKRKMRSFCSRPPTALFRKHDQGPPRITSTITVIFQAETLARLFAFFSLSALTFNPCLNAPEFPKVWVISSTLLPRKRIKPVI